MTAASRSGLHVLVVDDDPINLRIAARLLRELGHRGALVNSGAKALQLAGEQAFDVMLLDVNMPGLSGQDVLVELRRSSSGRPAPRVLMVSGHADIGTEQHFMAAGADGFITKPIDRDRLGTALARLATR